MKDLPALTLRRRYTCTQKINMFLQLAVKVIGPYRTRSRICQLHVHVLQSTAPRSTYMYMNYIGIECALITLFHKWPCLFSLTVVVVSLTSRCMVSVIRDE